MIRIGTSGFQFADWVGPVYPFKTRPQYMLSYYEQVLGFKTVEINYTYYSLPAQKTMLGMLQKTSDSFDFIIRSHKDMTHDIWTDDSRSVLKDTSDVFMKFMYGIKPMIEEGRLGCVLLQFPYFFYQNTAHLEYLEECRHRLSNVPLVIEFRNRGWINNETFEFLRSRNLGFCVVDEPPLQNLMPAVFETTAPIGYFRLHGRNRNWFGSSKEERYNYAYSKEELKGFIPHLKKMENAVERLYVFFNNCYGGHAAQNALLIQELLSEHH